jgi:hypothetical protein
MEVKQDQNNAGWFRSSSLENCLQTAKFAGIAFIVFLLIMCIFAPHTSFYDHFIDCLIFTSFPCLFICRESKSAIIAAIVLALAMFLEGVNQKYDPEKIKGRESYQQLIDLHARTDPSYAHKKISEPDIMNSFVSGIALSFVCLGIRFIIVRFQQFSDLLQWQKNAQKKLDELQQQPQQSTDSSPPHNLIE